VTRRILLALLILLVPGGLLLLCVGLIVGGLGRSFPSLAKRAQLVGERIRRRPTGRPPSVAAPLP
jgi:hypothetical protein